MWDSKPPSVRDNEIEIAADLVRNVDGEHQPLACEAAEKLLELSARLARMEADGDA